MALANPYKNYQSTSIQTATPERLLIYTYDLAIKNLKAARVRHSAGDLIRYRFHYFQLQSALLVLMAGLNHEVGGRFAQVMESLYWYMLEQVNQQLSSDLCRIDELLRLLEELRAAWDTAYRNLLKEQPVVQSPAGVTA